MGTGSKGKAKRENLQWNSLRRKQPWQFSIAAMQGGAELTNLTNKVNRLTIGVSEVVLWLARK